MQERNERGIMRKIIVAAVLAVPSIPAHSQPEPSPTDISNGNGLLYMCNFDRGTWQNAMCAGYITAIDDTSQVLGKVCPPGNSSRQQAMDVVIKGLREHPEDRAELSVGLIAQYLRAAFPCPKKT